MGEPSLGVIISNRNFFPDTLAGEARQDVLRVLKEIGVNPIILSDTDTKLGSVETWEDAKKCAALFKKNRERIIGILVVLPNFGDEKSVAESIKLSGLDVPVLIQAYPDDLGSFRVERRRDAFCGKISVCNNLHQYGIPFTLSDKHVEYLDSEYFRRDIQNFLKVCQVVEGMKHARLGAIGTRPNAFNTVRFSEKLLQKYNITVNTVDLSELIMAANRMPDSTVQVKEKLQAIKNYLPIPNVPLASLLKMAKLGVVLGQWISSNELDATAIQCWNSIENNYGIAPCTLMSMMSDRLMPSACEVDVAGALSMYALQLASGKPSGLADWNNNYGDDPNKCVLFHCGNWPKTFYKQGANMAYADVLATVLGKENTWGAIAGRIPEGPLTFARISTDDSAGVIRAYVGEGVFTNDPLDTFGSRAVAEIPNLQKLLKYICKNGFEHHVAINPSHSAMILAEAFGTYLSWDVYYHTGNLQDNQLP